MLRTPLTDAFCMDLLSKYISACYGVRDTLHKGDRLNGSYPGQQAELHYLCAGNFKATLQSDCQLVMYNTNPYVCIMFVTL